MSTMELETHLLSRVRMLPEALRLQVADYVEFLFQKYSDSAEQEVGETQIEDNDEYTPPYQNYSKQEVIDQINASLAEVDQSEDLEIAHAYMRRMGKQIAENNPW